MNVTISEQSSYIIFSIEGRVDVTTSPQLESRIHDNVKFGKENLILDCSKMSYISSSGLRVFLQTLKAMQKLGGSLLICGMTSDIKDIFTMTGLLQLFSVYETLSEALDS